jgi:predicted SAM-dependent methyltransferase
MKLNLGCGNHPLEGYLNVDLNPKFADVISDVRNLSSFEDGEAEEILATHLIEHFYIWEVQDILKEWKRVLKPGGSIYLECPNLRRCIAMLLEGGYGDRFTMWGLYGDPGHKEPLMCHKWGYTPETLAAELQKAGFVDIGMCETVKVQGRDMRLVATKPEEA